MTYANIVRRVAGTAAACVLALGLAGCAAEERAAQGGASAAREEEQVAGQAVIDDAPASEEGDPSADGRIDVTATGEQLATYTGAKYIVSDSTPEQRSGENPSGDMGFQEICVVRQPKTWNDVQNISWDRNSLQYTGIEQPWGAYTVRYEYLNEQGADEEVLQFSRTSEDAFFGPAEGVEHGEVSGHKLAYLMEDLGASELVMEDLAQDVPDEAAEDASETDGAAPSEEVPLWEDLMSARTVLLFAYEQKAPNCAFVTTITCEVNDGASWEPDARKLLEGAYRPLEFKDKDATVDAASYVSDVVITSPSGTNVALRREGDALVSYTGASTTLLERIESASLAPTLTFDFASQEEPGESVEQAKVANKDVRFEVRVERVETADGELEERTLRAWYDVSDDATLYVEASMADGEDSAAALERVLVDRVDVL